MSNWPSFIFVSNTNILSAVNLDVMMFVKHTHQHLQLLAGYYVSGVYFGYRIYTGKGNFVYLSDPQVQIIDSPVPIPTPPSPNPPPPQP